MEKYNLGEIPEDFDWRIYLIMNVDLINAGIYTEKAATQHYLLHGINECRIYYQSNKINYFIYCGQKCGSQTLRTTFMKSRIKSIKFHNNQDFCLGNKEFKSVFNMIDNNSILHDNIYIIDVYRNPIERKMSAYFCGLDKNDYDLSMDELTNKFNSSFIEKTFNLIVKFEPGNKEKLLYLLKKISEDIFIYEKHDTYIHTNLLTAHNLNIFCKILDENKESLGICYYKKKYLNDNYNLQSCDELIRYYDIGESFINFDFEQKYGTYQHKNIVFLKLRFCDIKDWGKILSKFFGKDITTFEVNLSEIKEYSSLYNKFKESYKIPREFLKELLKDEHFNSYNTIEERRKYIKYWLNRGY